MFIILPLKTNLRFRRPPFVTYAIALLCICIFVAQDYNRDAIFDSAIQYCTGIQTDIDISDETDLFRVHVDDCSNIVNFLHTSPSIDPALISEYLEFKSDEWSKTPPDRLSQLAQHHAEEFRLVAPRSLDAKLVYYPTT